MLGDSDWQVSQLRPVGSVGSSELGLLGAFLELLDRLTNIQQSATLQRGLAQWCDWADQTLAACLQLDHREAYQRQVVSNALARLRQRALATGCGVPIDLPLFLQLLEPEVEAMTSSTQGVAGGITFASVASLRLIPARIIYVLGMNDGEFPVAQGCSELDLIGRAPWRGDRSRRQDDRQIFLEWLCHGADQLVLSFMGRDIRDNSQRAASPLLAELLDYLGWEPTEQVLNHPAQAFGRRYGRDPDLFTYNSDLVVDNSTEPRPGFLELPLAPAAQTEITLSDLVNFFQNPARYFLNRRLGAWLVSQPEPMAALPPSMIDALSAFGLKGELVHQQLAGRSRDQCRDWVLSDVTVPDTPVGTAAVNTLLVNASGVADQLRCLVGDQQPAWIEGRVSFPDAVLNGRLGQVYGATRVVYRAGKIQARVRLKLWLEHLFLNALDSTNEPGIDSVLVCEDAQCHFGPAPDAATILQSLLAYYRAGQTRVLPLLPAASAAYAKYFPKGEARALAAARQALKGNDYSPGDRDDAHIQRVLQAGLELDQEFEAIALAVWQPLMAHLL